MNLKILLKLIVSMSLSAVAEDYTFTDTQGRSITGELIEYQVAKKMVSVKRAGKGVFTVPISTFIEADQSYILSWHTSRDFLSDRRLKIIIKRSKTKRTETELSNYHDHSFKIICKNASATDFDNVILRYCIYYTQDAHVGTDGLKTRKYGTFYSRKAMRIPGKSTAEFITQILCLETCRPLGNTSSRLKPANLYSDVEGIILKLSMTTNTGKEITRIVQYPQSLTYTWTTRTTDVQPYIP